MDIRKGGMNMANKKPNISEERVAHKQSFEWRGVIMPNGKTAGENADKAKNKKPPQKKK